MVVSYWDMLFPLQRAEGEGQNPTAQKHSKCFCLEESGPPAYVPLAKASQMAVSNQWGGVICLERESGNLWTNDTKGREWLPETGDSTVRRGLPGGSCHFAARVQPAMEHRGGIWGDKCLKPKSSLLSTSGQFSWVLHPPGSQRQESCFCVFAG